MNILLIQEYASSPFPEKLKALRRPNLARSTLTLGPKTPPKETARLLRDPKWMELLDAPPNVMAYLAHPEEFQLARAFEVAKAAARDGALLYAVFACAMAQENVLSVEDVIFQQHASVFAIRGFKPSSHSGFLPAEIIRLSESGMFGSYELKEMPEPPGFRLDPCQRRRRI